MILSTKNLRKEVSTDSGTLVILEDINLEVRKGETIAITGPSGSGKSTLLGLLAGLDDASGGEIFLNQHPLHLLNEEQRSEVRKENVGFVFQSFELLPGLTALENVMLPSELNSRNNAQELAQYYLKRVGLEERLNHYPRQLSGGEQQRVAIARALAAQPKILFADEPTGSLDEKNSKQVLDMLLNVNRKYNTSLVVITHSLAIASKLEVCLELKSRKISKK